jgi:hypothetical protein
LTLSLAVTDGASPASIAGLVSKYGELPPTYVEFLSAHDGVVPPENVVSDSEMTIGVRSFLPAREILQVALKTEGLPKNFIPIADDDSGNLVCINSSDHKIYFWDHEIERKIVVAINFGHFIAKLVNFDVDSVNLDPGMVNKVWVNPNFQPDF